MIKSIILKHKCKQKKTNNNNNKNDKKKADTCFDKNTAKKLNFRLKKI